VGVAGARGVGTDCCDGTYLRVMLRTFEKTVALSKSERGIFRERLEGVDVMMVVLSCIVHVLWAIPDLTGKD
jgi:hypothetical protein